jgi:DNA-binding GntR family transcriptional regulator
MLDPDDPRPPYLPVANAPLRAAILTGVFKPGDRLPGGRTSAKLADEAWRLAAAPAAKPS